MTLLWRCSTRRNLALPENVQRIESILSGLSDWLGQQLLIDDDAVRDGVLDLTEAGALQRWIQQELDRSMRNAETLRKFTGEEIPYLRGQGNVRFVSPDQKRSVLILFDEYTLAPVLEERHFGNSLIFKAEVTGARAESTASWALPVMRAMCDNNIFDHGFCCLSDEYDARNLDVADGGVRAVGLDAARWLPGFYWANYFGLHLSEMIGTEVLMSVPGCRSIRLASGVLVVHRMPPEAWNEPAFGQVTESAIAHIGRQVFFERGKRPSGRLFTEQVNA